MKAHRVAGGLWTWTAPHPSWDETYDWPEAVGCVYYEAPDAVVVSIIETEAPCKAKGGVLFSEMKRMLWLGAMSSWSLRVARACLRIGVGGAAQSPDIMPWPLRISRLVPLVRSHAPSPLWQRGGRRRSRPVPEREARWHDISGIACRPVAWTAGTVRLALATICRPHEYHAHYLNRPLERRAQPTPAAAAHGQEHFLARPVVNVLHHGQTDTPLVTAGGQAVQHCRRLAQHLHARTAVTAPVGRARGLSFPPPFPIYIMPQMY